MQVDTEFLRRQYSSLSDDALLAINRSDLVQAAQQCYDAELESRGLNRRNAKRAGNNPPVEAESAAPDAEAAEPEADAGSGTEAVLETEDAPDWIDDAVEVFSRMAYPGAIPAAEMADARDALEAAGIPCYLEAVLEELDESSPLPKGTQRLRLLVPGQMNLHAISVLDRDIFNADFEAQWKAHLQTLSDDEVLAMKPEDVFCGLFDRVERVTRTYDQEIARRKL